MKKLLLHVCCAPCSTSVVQRLRNDYELTLFFYNPNIHPQREYQKRLEETRRFVQMENILMIEGLYEIKEWFIQTKEYRFVLEQSGQRCEHCIALRLMKTAQVCKQAGYQAFTSTLSVSPHKNVQQINRIGKELGAELDIEFIDTDFKKQDGFKQSIELSKKHGLYRQDYCGCVYSRLERKAYHRYNRD